MKSLMAHCPVYRGNVANPPRGAARVTWAFDRMVITVSKDEIVEERGMVEALSFSPTYQPPPGTEDDPDPFYPPKYHRPSGIGDPFAQLDTSTAICACDEQGDCNYREDGF
jgi:ribonuclease Z